MKTTETKATSSSTSSIIDISEELKGIPKSERKNVANEIGELLVEEILSSLASVETPISGGKYKTRLSKEYAKKKQEETGSTDANLDLSGSMISALDYKVSGSTIEIGVFGREAPKADGHNNFSGESRLPTRQFLPNKGQSFKADILDLVKETVNNYKAESAELDAKKLEEIETKKELFDYLKSELGIESTSAMKSAVLGSTSLIELLDEYDLLDLIDG